MKLDHLFRVAITAMFISMGAVACENPTAAAPGFATKTTAGDVSFDLTPRGIADGQFVIDVRVNTHRGELADLDLQKATTLHVGEQALHPTAPVSLAGHHAGGELRFALAEAPTTFSVTISGVRSMPDITTQWP